MRKKLIYILVAVILLGTAWYFGQKIFRNMKKPNNALPSQEVSLYNKLESMCGGDGCCLQSVASMRNGGYKLAQNNECPVGFSGNMLRCSTSYRWCEPDKDNKSDTTSDWQTYRNEKYGFEFQYPIDWQIEEEVDWNTKKNITVITPGKRESCGSILGDGNETCLDRIELEVEDNAKAVSDLKAFFKEAWGWDENLFYKNYRTVVINGKTATRLTTIGAFDGTEDESVWFNIDNDSALSVQGIYLSENQNKIFEQIISTFKFTIQK